MSYFERQWKPISIKNTSPSYKTSPMSSFQKDMHWYNNLVRNAGQWKDRLEKYRQMDQTVDISRALDIIAEDVSSEGADDDKVFNLSFPEEAPKTSKLKTINKALDLWINKSEFDYRFFDFVREALQFGCIIFEEGTNGTLNRLLPDRIMGYILDEKDPEKVEYYLYDREGTIKDRIGETLFEGKSSSRSEKEFEKIDEKNTMILKVGEGPLGESILERIYRVWKQLQLLEDSVIIYRIVRAPERRVFYIDIGSMPVHKAESYVEKIKNKMRQQQINKEGNVETEYNPASMQEDYFIAQTGEGRGSRVETLPGGENLGRIEDLQFFNKKLALGLRIPPSYLDSYSDDVNGATHNDGRVGTAYIAELRYVGYVKRIQKKFAKELFTNFKKFSKKLGTELPEELDFGIEPPQSFAIYKENELYNAMLNTYSSADGIESMSKRYAIEKFLGMEKDEIVEMENYKLMEMGYSEKIIKSMEEEVRLNLVYGDGHLAPESSEEDINGFDQTDTKEPDPIDKVREIVNGEEDESKTT